MHKITVTQDGENDVFTKEGVTWVEAAVVGATSSLGIVKGDSDTFYDERVTAVAALTNATFGLALGHKFGDQIPFINTLQIISAKLVRIPANDVIAILDFMIKYPGVLKIDSLNDVDREVPDSSTQVDSTLESAIETVARLYNVQPDFAVAVAWMESKLDPNAISPTGALGLFQLTTIAIEDLERNDPDFVPRISVKKTDPSWNIKTGVLYIRRVAGFLKIDPSHLGLDDMVRIYAAYNIGIGSLRDLESGNHSARLRRAVGNQSRMLSEGRLSDYLARVRVYLSEALAVT